MTFQHISISAAEALDLVRRVADHAHSREWNVAVAVTDAQGNALASLRMDRAAPPILDFAQDKAYTAATMRRSTAAFAERMAETHSLTLGLSNRQRLLAWGGGLPIVHDGAVIGGIGVSGAKDFEDIECAEVALRALNFGWVL